MTYFLGMGGLQGPRTFDVEACAAQARVGFWECDLRRARFTGSDIVYELLDLPGRGEVDLSAVFDACGGSAPGSLKHAIEKAASDGEPFGLITEIRTSSGQRRWIRTLGQAVHGSEAEPGVVSGTMQDISELRLLDRVTQESEMTLNQVEEITHIGHWSVSLTDGSLFHSDEVKRIFGYDPSKYTLTVEQAINAYHPDDRAEVIRLFNRAAETGEGYEFDLRVVQPSGALRHVHSKGYAEKNDQGRITRVFGVFQDITERVAAEQALRASEASMKHLVDAIHTAIVVHDGRGEILLSNKMANRLLAPLTTEVVGKDLRDPAWRFVFEDGRAVPIDDLPVSRILRERRPIENLVLGRQDPGGVAWLLVNGVPIFDDDETLSRVIVSFVDITERKEMEDRLHQAERMNAIGQLAGSICHDFNNQLMIMMSYSELLKGSRQLGAEEHSWVTGMQEAISRSDEITKQLLAFAHKGNYVAKVVDIGALIAEVVRLAGHSFDKRIRIRHQDSARPATVKGDVSQLHSAVLNVALNARDAMPDGGELVFETSCVALEAQAARELALSPGEYVRIRVRDTGIGMDAVTQKHIFEPFFTTKARGKGTGLGMASVYGTVKNHQGAVSVHSEPGAGTTVTMYLPLTLEVEAVPEGAAPSGRRVGGRVLIVDDEEGIAAPVSAHLRQAGYEPRICLGGEDAIAAFRRSWQSTDLVLLDLSMPDMHGAEVLRQLKAIDPNVKVILMSGYSFTDDAGKVDLEGAVGFLTKPIPSRQLLEAVAQGLRAPRVSAVPKP